MPAEGRDLRWKQRRKGAGSREWPTAYYPADEQEIPDRHHTCTSEGDDPRGRRRQGVNRPDDAPAGQSGVRAWCQEFSRDPVRWSRPGNPCASRMIPLESPVPEIGTPGSESGGRKRAPRDSACGPAAKAPDKPPTPYRLRASPRLYTNVVGTLLST